MCSRHDDEDVGELHIWQPCKTPLDYAVGFLDRFVPIAIVVALAIAAVMWWVKPALSDMPRTDANIVTALDVSSSINALETMLQIEGMAQAIKDPSVVAAIQAGRIGRIGFVVFVWADGDYPELVSWRTIAGPDDAAAAADEIMAKLQGLIDSSSRSVGTLTNLSGAMEHAGELLKAAPFATRRQVLNIVGNGEDNVGEDPARARAALLAIGATINGVVIGGDANVMNYYRNQVIGGMMRFVLPAASADDLVAVFSRKFVTEISAR